MNSFCDYNFIWNALHYPAGSVPVTEVLPEEEDPSLYKDGYEDMWTKAIRKDMVGSAGMPVGVQVIAQSWQDEVVLGVMRALEQGIGYRKEY